MTLSSHHAWAFVLAIVGAGCSGCGDDVVETEFYPSSPRWGRVYGGGDPAKRGQFRDNDLIISTFMRVPANYDVGDYLPPSASWSIYSTRGKLGPGSVRLELLYGRQYRATDIPDAINRPCFRQFPSTDYTAKMDLTILRIPRPDGVLALCFEPGQYGSWYAARILSVGPDAVVCHVDIPKEDMPLGMVHMRICDTLVARSCAMASLTPEIYTACGPWSH